MGWRCGLASNEPAGDGVANCEQVSNALTAMDRRARLTSDGLTISGPTRNVAGER